MPLPSRLPQLPSLGELLEHPRVKGLVARVNRSTIAQRAAGFLEEVRATLQARSPQGETPSLALLAERLARRLLGDPIPGGPLINATGLILGDPTFDPPLPESALHAMVQLAGEYHYADHQRRRAVERRLADLCRAEAAFVAGSFEAAVTLTVAAAVGHREFALDGDPGATDPIDWRRLAARVGAVLAPHGAEASDSSTAVVRAPDAAGADAAEPLASLSAPRRAQPFCVIDVAPDAGIIDPGGSGLQHVATVSQRLAAGADVVLIDGAGLLGGPRCGAAIGRRSIVEEIARGPLAALAPMDAVRLAGLDAVLQLYRDDVDGAMFHVPVWQLASAPLANLQQRAQRLATLMGESPAVASASARRHVRPWRRIAGRASTAETWVVEIRPAGGEGAALAASMARGPFAIASEDVAGGMILDLRSVFPRWDQQLVAAVEAANTIE